MNPGSARAEIEATIDAFVAESGDFNKSVIAQAIAESNQAIQSAKESGSVARSGGRINATVTLGKGRYAGDIFVTPASTLGIQYGHTGIHFNASTIVEAPGLDKVSRSVSATSLQVAPNGGTSVMPNDIKNSFWLSIYETV